MLLVIGNIRSLISLGGWYDWVIGIWYHRVIGIIELLVPLGHWYYCVMHWFSHLSKLAYLAMIYYLEYVAFDCVYKLILRNWCISVFRFNKKHDILDGLIAVVFDDWCVYSQSCVDHDSQFTHLVFCANLLLALLCKHLMGIMLGSVPRQTVYMCIL